MQRLLDNSNFYDELAKDYDSMISFTNSVNIKKNLLKSFIHAETKYAADIGCGTGADSISLALNGLKVTAFDPSTEMLKQAETNARNYKVKIDLQNISADTIPNSFNNSFDLIVSLGNSFANIPKENFNNSLKKCFEILKPKGKLLIQILNYEKILTEKKRIISLKKGEGKYFIRFYDFIEDHLVFNLLKFDQQNPSNYNLFSTKIFPYIAENFLSELSKTGFTTVELFSDLAQSKYVETNSNNLVILAAKG